MGSRGPFVAFSEENVYWCWWGKGLKKDHVEVGLLVVVMNLFSGVGGRDQGVGSELACGSGELVYWCR